MKQMIAALSALLLITLTMAACEKTPPAPEETQPSTATEVQAEVPTQAPAEPPFELYLDGIPCPQNASEIRLSSAPGTVLELLPRMSELRQVTVTEGDCENLEALRQYCDEAGISFQIELGGQILTEENSELTVSHVTEEQVRLLAVMPNLKTLHFPEPEAPAHLLLQLRQDRAVTWDKTVLGMTFSQDAVQIDLTPVIALAEEQHAGEKTAYDYGLEEPVMSYQEEIPSSFLVTAAHPLPDKTAVTAELIAQVEAAMQYFPQAEKLTMTGAWLDNEAMARFREDHREDYKVVWSVQCGMLATRTDATLFMPTKFYVTQGNFTDWHTYNLMYCEDMVAMDIGHMTVVGLDFVRYMPQLKYLVITLSQVEDLGPLSACKNLVFLEMDWCDRVLDYSPLLECTALEDLNIGETFGDITPVLDMTWLKNLWVVGGPEESYILAREALPETNVAYHYANPDDGWRELPNYFRMRDALLMFYMK